MKETSELSIVKSNDLRLVRSIRRTFNCATLTGTAALAAFLAMAAAPAQAARHHHHQVASSQSAPNVTRGHHHHSEDEQVDNSGTTRHHHRRHSDSDESQVAANVTPKHHRRHHHDDDVAANAPVVAPHRHHHHDSDAEASATPVIHRHRHHHDTDDVEAATPSLHRHHHHDADVDASASPVEHHRRHHHVDEDADNSAAAAPKRHHPADGASPDTAAHRLANRHAAPTETASAESRHNRAHESSSALARIARLLRDPAWQAHVARYEAHLQVIERSHELRLAEIEAHEANVREADNALHSGDVVRAAEAFRGTPYVMGGTSRSGFDCSGFTRYIFGQSAGVDLPRTAEEQYYTGQAISKGDLRAGDLVFFKDTYRHGISHVGMYIGDGRFVHACNPEKGVTVSSLSEQYYINHWAGARRVMQNREDGE